jgi:hypothetical protein
VSPIRHEETESFDDGRLKERDVGRVGRYKQERAAGAKFFETCWKHARAYVLLLEVVDGCLR